MFYIPKFQNKTNLEAKSKNKRKYKRYEIFV